MGRKRNPYRPRFLAFEVVTGVSPLLSRQRSGLQDMNSVIAEESAEMDPAFILCLEYRANHSLDHRQCLGRCPTIGQEAGGADEGSLTLVP